MDIYQIIMIHNRMWSVREIAVFAVIAVIVLKVLVHLFRNGKIQLSQAVAAMLLAFFLGIVFGSTVFTRTATTQQWKPTLGSDPNVGNLAST